jgi:hypothetical protein
MRISHFFKLYPVAVAALLSASPAWLPAQEPLLLDDFDGAPLDTSTWGLADWNIGDRVFECVAFSRRAETETVELRKDEPHPVAPLAAVPQLFEDTGVNRFLGLCEAVQFERVTGIFGFWV